MTKRAHDEHNELIEREMSTLLWSHERKASTSTVKRQRRPQGTGSQYHRVIAP